jgi:hypothetical protein
MMTRRQRSTLRRQRVKAKVNCAIDWETRCPMELGTQVHQEIERVLMMRNAPFVGHVLINGGDFIHHDQHFAGERVKDSK